MRNLLKLLTLSPARLRLAAAGNLGSGPGQALSPPRRGACGGQNRRFSAACQLENPA